MNPLRPAASPQAMIAALDPSDVLNTLQKPEAGQSGLGLFFAVVGLFVLLFMIWAIFIRKPRDERARRYRYGSRSDSSSSTSTSGEQQPNSSKRRRRRRRNPTLAETGGLPPPRDSVPSDDPP
jgi:hypothetical protein